MEAVILQDPLFTLCEVWSGERRYGARARGGLADPPTRTVSAVQCPSTPVDARPRPPPSSAKARLTQPKTSSPSRRSPH